MPSAAAGLAFREHGGGPLLLILPGNTASSAHHLADLEHFGRHYRAVAPDFHGTGRSGRRAPWPLTWWEDNAHATAALLAQLSWPDAAAGAVVIGTSGGALTALLLAALHPERVRAVIADSTVARFPPGWLEAAVADRRRRTPEQTAFWQAGHGADWEQVVDADSDLLLRLSAAGGDVLQGRPRLIRCPVLLTASLADPLLPDPGPQALALAQQIPDSRAWLTREGGHPLMWSRAPEWRRAVAGFLEGVAAG
ncbi:MAG: alpha/beta hydrolase [Anaerolineales bacterium]|nr:alpha/beta hydrolase [Anaerolineales bacterium]